MSLLRRIEPPIAVTARGTLPWVLCLWALLSSAAALAGEGSAPDSTTDADELNDDARLRLTEREDKLRPAQRLQIDIAGRPLTVGGELAADLEVLRRPETDGTPRRRERLSAYALELEAFYPASATLSAFMQLRLAHERDRHARDPTMRFARYVERGEMWLHAREVAGLPLNLEFGRLKFEDDRRWWWNQELDAVRLSHRGGGVEAALAFGRELGRRRSDRRGVDAEQEGVHRWLAQAGWEWASEQTLNAFALRQGDRSGVQSPGQIVPIERQDASDARLTWLGVGVAGKLGLRGGAAIDYDLDTASVRGDERLIEFSAPSAGPSTVSAVSRRGVRGWGLDSGLRWTFASVLRPRLFVGYAVGSGGPASDGADRSFRQTGLHANEAGFGGVKRFAHYGAALDPELSNLRISTLGAGLSLSRSSSLDLVYHRYRQVSAATSLRAARVEPELTGTHRDIGSGLDIVAAVEAWQRIEIAAIASSLRTGSAFGTQAGRRYR